MPWLLDIQCQEDIDKGLSYVIAENVEEGGHSEIEISMTLMIIDEELDFSEYIGPGLSLVSKAEIYLHWPTKPKLEKLPAWVRRLEADCKASGVQFVYTEQTAPEAVNWDDI